MSNQNYIKAAVKYSKTYNFIFHEDNSCYATAQDIKFCLQRVCEESEHNLLTV